MSIHIEDLTVRFKNSVTAIDHADLDISNGIFGLLGENGAGNIDEGFNYCAETHKRNGYIRRNFV